MPCELILNYLNTENMAYCYFNLILISFERNGNLNPQRTHNTTVRNVLTTLKMAKDRPKHVGGHCVMKIIFVNSSAFAGLPQEIFTWPIQKVSDLWPEKIHLHAWRSATIYPLRSSLLVTEDISTNGSAIVRSISGMPLCEWSTVRSRVPYNVS